MSLALQGAKAVAVDIAPSHVETGRAKAAELRVDVDYHVGDMTALPDDLTGFDTIYISWGGLCWVPDQLALSASYFEQKWIGQRDLAKEPQVVKELGLEWQPHQAFVWNLGEVISAFLQAGLVVVALQEFHDQEMYSGFTHGHHLPAVYIAAGERPAG